MIIAAVGAVGYLELSGLISSPDFVLGFLSVFRHLAP